MNKTKNFLVGQSTFNKNNNNNEKVVFVAKISVCIESLKGLGRQNPYNMNI